MFVNHVSAYAFQGPILFSQYYNNNTHSINFLLNNRENNNEPIVNNNNQRFVPDNQEIVIENKKPNSKNVSFDLPNIDSNNLYKSYIKLYKQSVAIEININVKYDHTS